ncbi:MAG: 2'-5' RNA ligase family protein [Myxococcota bacterium]
MSSRRVVVAFPRVAASAGWDRVQELRQRFDPRPPCRGAPDAGLPVRRSGGGRRPRGHLREALGGAAPFDVVFAGVTLHEGTALFLNVKRGNDAVVSLHDSLYRGILAPHRSRGHTFVPHVTVGRVAAGDVAAALEASAGIEAPVTGVVDRVSVYEVLGDGARPVRFEVALTGGR